MNVNVNLKCFSMLPEGEAYNRVLVIVAIIIGSYYIYNKVRARGLNFIHNIQLKEWMEQPDTLIYISNSHSHSHFVLMVL